MKKKVTINDIAQMCNVSKSSVSRYLNHGYVSKENAEKIQRAIDETGFQSNFFASRIKRKDSHLIGIIVPSFANYGVGKMLDGILNQLTVENYQGMILQSQGRRQKEEESVHLLQQQGVDGILFLDSLFAENYRDEFQDSDMKILFANQECSYAPSISFHEHKAVESVVEYLHQKHHQSLLYLMKHGHASELRKEAMQELWQGQLHILPAALHEEGIYDQAKEVLRKKADVLLCDGDETALCCMKYFAQMHIRVPHEISVVSFSETPLYDLSNPSLTHVAYDYEGFGTHLASSMLRLLQGKDVEEEHTFTRLLEKESTAEYNENE